jgi:hypothetical protein
MVPSVLLGVERDTMEVSHRSPDGEIGRHSGLKIVYVTIRNQSKLLIINILDRSERSAISLHIPSTF